MTLWPVVRIVEIADGIVVALNGKGEMGVANASCICDGKSAMVVDTMTFPEMVLPLLYELQKRGCRVETVVNTHHHIDHIGGNMLFEGARLVAHPQTVKLLHHIGKPVALYDTLMPHFRGRFDTLELAVPEPALATIAPPRGGKFRVFTAAHTATDVTVWIPEQRVLLAGDICFNGVTPLTVHGLFSGWIAALETLLALNPRIVVPGHGAVGDAQALRIMRDYLCAVSHMGQRVVAENIPFEDALRMIEQGPVAQWREPDRTRLNLARAIQEARGEITTATVSTISMKKGRQSKEKADDTLFQENEKILSRKEENR